MKKIINLVLITITIATVGNINARVVSVTRDVKQMLTDTKALRNATTAQDKVNAANKLANNMRNDEYSQLKMDGKIIQKDITEKEDEIAQSGGGYFSYFDSDEVTELRNELIDLKEELVIVQKRLNTIRGIQPKIETKLKDWAIYTLLTAVTLVVADQLITGGAGRTAIMTGASTVGTTVGSKLKSAWEQFRSSTPTTVTSEGSSSVKSIVTAGAGAVASFGASLVIEELKARALNKTIDTLMSYISDPNTDPEMRDEYIKETEKTKTELKNVERKIEKGKKLEEQITQQRNL